LGCCWPSVSTTNTSSRPPSRLSQVGRAPLRADLARALVLSAGFTDDDDGGGGGGGGGGDATGEAATMGGASAGGDSAVGRGRLGLLDPFCGSGTVRPRAHHLLSARTRLGAGADGLPMLAWLHRDSALRAGGGGCCGLDLTWRARGRGGFDRVRGPALLTTFVHACMRRACEFALRSPSRRRRSASALRPAGCAPPPSQPRRRRGRQGRRGRRGRGALREAVIEARARRAQPRGPLPLPRWPCRWPHRSPLWRSWRLWRTRPSSARRRGAGASPRRRRTRPGGGSSPLARPVREAKPPEVLFKRKEKEKCCLRGGKDKCCLRGGRRRRRKRERRRQPRPAFLACLACGHACRMLAACLPHA